MDTIRYAFLFIENGNNAWDNKAFSSISKTCFVLIAVGKVTPAADELPQDFNEIESAHFYLKMTTLPGILTDFDNNIDKGVAAYFNYGAGNEVTLNDNVQAFERFRLKPSLMQPCIDDIDVTTTILGQQVNSPLGIAPTAFHKLLCPEGELETAKAASNCKVCYIEGLASQSSMYEMNEQFSECFRWKNIYPCTEMGMKLTVQLMRDCEKNGISGFAFSIDNPNTEFKPSCNPSWKVDFSGIEVPDITRAARSINGVCTISALSMFSKYFRTPDFTWKKYKWLTEQTKLPMIAKGVLTAEDAMEAVKCGSAAVYVSNHGGRWLDSRVPTLFALPEIVEAVGNQVEVYIDGGVRNGVDVFKALALGARAVFLGRPIVWGLGANGSQGAQDVIEGMVSELKEVMAYTGCRETQDISRSNLL